ncbi:hypothetical protein DNTS_035845 [Danionella cerebrum]|uniref:CCAAT/enhancer-binding protein zeta n=1 Tax=Danionella cerebrum TaxID=2873325 RepID=A0A553Q3I2_9TELE|nr:hypothetical protein DNTS_035845 [Danionella translucida]
MRQGNMAEHKQRRSKKSEKMMDHESEDNDDVEDNDNDDHESDEHDDEFTLDDVLGLGGTKADYVMLASIDDSTELINGGKKVTIDDLEKGELEKFITKLGIRAYADQQIIQEDQPETSSESAKKEKKKAKKSKIVEDTTSEEKPTEETSGTKDATTSVQPKVVIGKKAKQKVTNLFEFIPRQTLLIKPGGKWFEQEYTSEGTSEAQDEMLVSQYKDLAQKLYNKEVVLYKTKKSLQKGANTSWMKNLVTTGTLVDRIASTTVLIHDAPVHSLQLIESLVSQVKKKGNRRLGLMALDTLKELLLSNLLPNDRKLRTFSQHPFEQLEEKASGNRDSRDRRLILWYFEHQLKLCIADFIAALDELSHDTVQANKMRALTTSYELLCNQPEQEKLLLVHIINKLGDPEYKIASKASYLLETLLYAHPNMKMVVCCEVERLMFRPNISSKAQYYAACFLNQVVLSHDEADLAGRLITIYFAFFNACIKKKDVQSKMLSALLTGVNRAYPYAKIEDDNVSKHLNTLFETVHVVKFSTAVQALMLLFQVMNSQQTISDRYYVALYRKLLDPTLYSTSMKSMFLNLLYKSLKTDIVLRRVKAFVKRLLQVSCLQTPAFICGALFLVSEDDEDEVYLDFNEEEEDDENAEERPVVVDKEPENLRSNQSQTNPTASWVHQKNLEGGANKTTYDPLNRNPLYCGADHTVLWELQKLSLHFHPSVALFAKTILQGESITYTGDPLQDFTLIRFLDRFVFRNPKQSKGKLNSKQYLAKEESQIPVDEVFFYRYFKKQDEKRLKRSKQDEDESHEDVDDDEFDRLLEGYEGDSYFTDSVMRKSKKGRKQEEEEEDSDEDIDDLDDEEVSLGSMEDFEDECEEEGGEFMDVDDEADDGSDDDAAEEFGCMLDENTSNKFDSTTMNALSNADKAGVKQLRWEAQRNDWIHGRDVKTLRRKKATFNKKRMWTSKKSKGVKKK